MLVLLLVLQNSLEKSLGTTDLFLQDCLQSSHTNSNVGGEVNIWWMYNLTVHATVCDHDDRAGGVVGAPGGAGAALHPPLPPAHEDPQQQAAVRGPQCHQGEGIGPPLTSLLSTIVVHFPAAKTEDQPDDCRGHHDPAHHLR